MEKENERDEPVSHGLQGKMCFKLNNLEQKRIVARQPSQNEVTRATGMTQSLT